MILNLRGHTQLNLKFLLQLVVVSYTNQIGQTYICAAIGTRKTHELHLIDFGVLSNYR